MEFSDGFFVVQVVNFLILLGWLIGAIYALWTLRRMEMPPTAKALWTLIVLVIPFLGAVAFFLVRPAGKKS